MCCSNRNKQKSSAIGKKIENIAVIVTIVIVLGLFTLPIIFYYTSSYNRDTSNNASIYYKGFNSNITGISQNCTRLSWSQDNDASECHEYTGIACRNFLHQWFQCTIGEGELNIGVSQQEQNQHEQTITSLNSYLEIYKQCQQQSSAFICQYFFPLADCSTGKSYKATKEDCLLISTGVCSDLWTLANNSGNGSLLPDCSTLPNAANDSSSVTIPIEGMNDTNDSDGIECREDFVKTDLICEPRCDSFEGSSHSESFFFYSEVVATSISLTFCIVAIIVAVKEYKTLLAYPSILVLFQVIDITVLGIVLITTAIYRYELYCSSVSLLETLNNPTPFCKFSGVVFHYTFANMALSWFFHVAIFFYKVLFPFQANRFEKLGRNKYIFATVTILSLLLPLPAIIICLTVDKFKYNIHRFPTTICTSSSGMMFYSITLLMDVLFATGVIMLIIVLWTMRNNTHFLNKRRGHTKLSTAEKKILLAFSIFIIFGVFNVAHQCNTEAKNAEYQAALEEYFECEALGYIPGKCDRGTFDKIRSPYMSATAYILMNLIPLSILNFILKWSSVKSAGNKAVTLTKRYSSFLYCGKSGKSSSATSCESVPDDLSSKSDKSTNSQNSAV